MKFKFYKEKTKCECLQDSFEDYENVYVRLARLKEANPVMKVKDFKGQRENKDAEYFKEFDCKMTCGYLGISTNIWNEESQEIVKSKFERINLILSRKMKKVLVIFKLNGNAGKFVYAPIIGKNGMPDDIYHYDFYKSDEFDFETHFNELQQIDL